MEGNTSETTESATSPESEATFQGEQPSAPSHGASPFDLDTAEKFTWGGKEWTRDELKRATMRHDDYTRKTQQIATERKYSENLYYDLAKVRDNPQLAAEFKKIYPESYHRHLEQIIKNQPTQAHTAQANQVDPALMARLSHVESLIHEKEVQAIESELDRIFPQMQKKYPFADEEVCISRAQALLDQAKRNGDGNIKITEKTWDKIWSEVNTKSKARSDEYQKNLVRTQTTANSRGRDNPPGGGIPGQAPQRLKLKDVAQHIIDDMGKQ